MVLENHLNTFLEKVKPNHKISFHLKLMNQTKVGKNKRKKKNPKNSTQREVPLLILIPEKWKSSPT